MVTSEFSLAYRLFPFQREKHRQEVATSNTEIDSSYCQFFSGSLILFNLHPND